MEYLGEKVVKEKEYLSAIMERAKLYSGTRDYSQEKRGKW
jgi:hypothetical protein